MSPEILSYQTVRKLLKISGVVSKRLRSQPDETPLFKDGII